MDQLMSRGGFLRGLAACGAVGTAGCRMFTGAESDFDDSFAVFLSDSHVCGNDELHPDERKPEVWKAIIEENQGQFCRFPFARMLRAV